MLNKVSTLLALSIVGGLSLTGCAGLHADIGLLRAASLDLEPPPGDPVYQQGWRDGCESGISGYGSQFYKHFYSWKQDPYKVTDPVYYQVWKDAYAFCRTFSMTTGNHGLGNMRSPW